MVTGNSDLNLYTVTDERGISYSHSLFRLLGPTNSQLIRAIEEYNKHIAAGEEAFDCLVEV